jgi:hypothetical protein
MAMPGIAYCVMTERAACSTVASVVAGSSAAAMPQRLVIAIAPRSRNGAFNDGYIHRVQFILERSARRKGVFGGPGRAIGNKPKPAQQQACYQPLADWLGWFAC